MRDVMTDYLEQIRRYMQANRITQKQLAAASGTPEPNISRIFRGKEGLSLDRANTLAEALGLELVLTVREKSKNLQKTG